MRNGALRIPSLMMSFGNNSSNKNQPFNIQENNLFMGPKRPVPKIRKLTPDQKVLIHTMISEDKSTKYRQAITTATFTAIFISICLLLVF